jgi:hypothetical protein
LVVSHYGRPSLIGDRAGGFPADQPLFAESTKPNPYVAGIFLAVRWSNFKVDHDLLEAGGTYWNRKPYVVLGGQ